MPRLRMHGQVYNNTETTSPWQFTIEGNRQYALFTADVVGRPGVMMVGAIIRITNDQVNEPIFVGTWRIVALLENSLRFIAERTDAH